MSKSDLQFAQREYDRWERTARTHEMRSEFVECVAAAKRGWPFVADTMKYERKYEHRTFSSIGCIDLVLEYAPPLFDIDSLNELEWLLKDDRSIDRAATDDLAARLLEARNQIAKNLKAWRLLDAGDVEPRILRRDAAITNPECARLLLVWTSIGCATRSSVDGLEVVKLQSLSARRLQAECSECGTVCVDKGAAFLDDCPCPRCATRTYFVIRTELNDMK
jgi:hypothetical protein